MGLLWTWCWDGWGDGGCLSVFSSLTGTGTERDVCLFYPDSKEHPESSLVASGALMKRRRVGSFALLWCRLGRTWLMLVPAKESRSDTSVPSAALLSAEAVWWSLTTLCQDRTDPFHTHLHVALLLLPFGEKGRRPGPLHFLLQASQLQCG